MSIEIKGIKLVKKIERLVVVDCKLYQSKPSIF